MVKMNILKNIHMVIGDKNKKSVRSTEGKPRTEGPRRLKGVERSEMSPKDELI